MTSGLVQSRVQLHYATPVNAAFSDRSRTTSTNPVRHQDFRNSRQREFDADMDLGHHLS